MRTIFYLFRFAFFHILLFALFYYFILLRFARGIDVQASETNRIVCITAAAVADTAATVVVEVAAVFTTFDSHFWPQPKILHFIFKYVSWFC